MKSVCLSSSSCPEPALIHGGERNHQLGWPFLSRNNIADRKEVRCVLPWRAPGGTERRAALRKPPLKDGRQPRVALRGLGEAPQPLLLVPAAEFCALEQCQDH